MAIGGDGTITLTTKVDQAGLKKGVTSMKNSVKGMSSSLLKLGGIIGTVFSIRTIIRFSGEASKMASNTEASVQRLIDIYGEASESVGEFIDTNARALGMSRSAATGFSAVYGNLFSVWADQKTNAELTNQYLNMTAVVASKTGRTMEDVQERIRSGLLGNTEAVEDLGIFVNIKTIEMTEAFQRVAQGAKWDSLTAYQQSQVRTLAILEQATKKYGNTVANTTAFTRLQYNAAFQDFQATWGKVVNIVLMPILRIATRILNTLTAGLQAIAGLTGKTIDTSKIQASTSEETADAIGGAVDNQKDLADATKKTAKEQKKLLAGFDEIEILSRNTADSAGGAGGGVGGVGGVGGLDILETGIDETKYTSKLATIGMITGWALVGLGVILMFSGHPLIGIGMVATGYVLSAGAAEGGKDLGEKEKTKLVKIGTIVGVALIGLGTLLLFTSFWKLGLGMIASGATAVYSALALGNFSQDIKKKVTDILLITGTVMMVLGTILLFVPGFELFGIAMLAAGAAEIITAAILNYATIKQWISENLWVLVKEAGNFLFIVGIILLFVPGMMNWGIAAMVAGLAIVGVSAIVPNWNEIKSTIKTFFEDNWEAITAISAAFLVLGVILCIASLWGIGLTMIGIGAAGLYGVTAANWDGIKTQISDFVTENYKAIVGWSAALLVLGTILLFVPGCLGIGLTLIGLSATALWGANQTKLDSSVMSKNLTTELDKVNTSAQTGVNKINNTLSGIGGSASLSGGGNFNVSGGGTRGIKVTGYAKGTIVPPNKPFLGILGDNKNETEVVSPVSTLKTAFKEAMLEMNGTGGNSTVVLELDGRELGRAVLNTGNQESRRLGTKVVFG